MSLDSYLLVHSDLANEKSKQLGCDKTGSGSYHARCYVDSVQRSVSKLSLLQRGSTKTRERKIGCLLSEICVLQIRKG